MFDNLVRFRKVVCAKKSYTLIYKKEILFTYILFTEKKKHKHVQEKKKNLCTCKIFNNPENAGENFGQTIHQYLQIVNKHTKL